MGCGCGDRRVVRDEDRQLGDEESDQRGWQGEIYPINPGREIGLQGIQERQGRRRIDVAVFAIPAKLPRR
jgi:hypothetical protein